MPVRYRPNCSEYLAISITVWSHVWDSEMVSQLNVAFMELSRGNCWKLLLYEIRGAPWSRSFNSPLNTRSSNIRQRTFLNIILCCTHKSGNICSDLAKQRICCNNRLEYFETAFARLFVVYSPKIWCFKFQIVCFILNRIWKFWILFN